VYRTGKSFVARGGRVIYPGADGRGHEYFQDIILQPMRDEHGVVDGILVLGHDVTEQVRANRALRRSERRFRGAIDAVQGTLWTRDCEGKAKGEQPGWAALTGQNHEEYQDYGWVNAVHPDDAQPTMNAWKEAVAAHRPFEFEHRVRRADGEWRRFSVRAIPLLNDDGAVEEWVGVHTDITEQCRAREILAEARERLEVAVAERTAALQQSEARVRTIFETSHSFQGLLTPDGIVLDANTTSLEAIKARREDVVGKPFWETPWFAGTPGMAEAVKMGVSHAAAGGSGTRAVTVDLPTGVRSFDFSLRPVKNERGEVVAIVPEAFETTARLKAEAALRQAQALEAVGQLTGGVAHDFNNLLMVLSGGLTLMERRDDPARRPMLIAHMREAVDRGANLTRQLLAFSRKQELTPEIIDFAQRLDGMHELLTRSLGANMRIEVETAEDLAPIFVDPMALQLAVLNLAVNARDAMPEGGTILIKATNGSPEDPQAPFVSVAVIDEGVGMTPEVQARIFEPFFTTKETGKGSGLGLAQVHGFAQQSGGRVEVRSKPGAGTTMMLILPASRERRRPVAKPAATDAHGKRPSREAGDALLVEDNDEVAALTREMLEDLGWRVTRVASGEAALGALADGRRIDLVFSDVMMPGGMSGLDLARKARRRRPHIPIVLTSGYAEPIRRQAEEAGLPLLPKPFNLDDLAAALDRALA
jgi:PAS domain S-box-containing protein